VNKSPRSLSLLDGTAQLVATLLYGSGLRIMEAVRLRVKDIDVQMKQLTVRSDKGDKDRCTTFPATLTPLLQNHLARVKPLHQQDPAQGHGEVYLPHALARKSPHTATEWGWQYVFPARDISADPRAGIARRHHVDPSVINKAIKVAVRRAGLTKHISAHTLRHNPAYLLMSRVRSMNNSYDRISNRLYVALRLDYAALFGLSSLCGQPIRPRGDVTGAHPKDNAIMPSCSCWLGSAYGLVKWPP
jgi:integrase